VAGLLTDKDITVRGYGAQWLGIVGDDSCKADLVRLLKPKPGAAEKPKAAAGLGEPGDVPDVMAGFDRQMAVAALGMLKAKECVKDIVPLLEDPNARVRAGAAMALGIMKAKEQADAIAKSLDYKSSFDPRAEEAQMAAIIALVALDAKQHAPAIAKRIASHRSVGEFAIFAIVALDAKEQTKDIAAVLDDNFKGGDAALALGLMDATDYTTRIDGLLKKRDYGFVRCKAAIALGILRAEKHAPDIVDFMKSPKDYERTTAAWALVLLENKEHAAEAIAIIGKDGEKTFFSAWAPNQGGIVVADQLDKIGERAVKSFRMLREEVKKNKTRPLR
jgi:HEAT repeat protein